MCSFLGDLTVAVSRECRKRTDRHCCDNRARAGARRSGDQCFDRSSGSRCRSCGHGCCWHRRDWRRCGSRRCGSRSNGSRSRCHCRDNRSHSASTQLHVMTTINILHQHTAFFVNLSRLPAESLHGRLLLRKQRSRLHRSQPAGMCNVRVVLWFRPAEEAHMIRSSWPRVSSSKEAGRAPGQK
jgi:hypothetical protein